MKRERRDEEVKARVTPDVKKHCEMIARSRHLDLSDILREAVREYLAKYPEQQADPKQQELPV